MKVQSTVSVISLKKRLAHVFALLCFAALPAIGICQPAGPGGGDGGNPDGVPFDSNMNLLFLAAGIVFAVVVVVRKMNKKVTVVKH